MKDLIGKKVKGFKFGNGVPSAMDMYIGKVGVVKAYNEDANKVKVVFNDDYWWYPAEQIEAHLVDEWVVGEEYEFSDYDDAGCGWYKHKLVAVLPEKFKERFVVEYLENDTVNYSEIRHIEDPIQKQTEQL